MRNSLLLILLIIYCRLNLLGQTVLINSATQGGFESGSGFAANGWTVVNGTQTNRWYCVTPGNPATPFAGSNCAYISNTHPGGGSYAYTVNQASVVHFYMDVTIPAGEPYLNLQFRYKGQAEACCDFIRVFAVSTSVTPVAGTQLTTGQIGGTYNAVGTTWTLANINFCATPGSTIRLVFSWRNDNSLGTQPPAAIDNIHLTSSSTAPPCALGTGVTTVASLPYSSGSGTTCGAVNDLTSSNTTLCGSSLYLEGEDRVWIFTPTSSGNITINLTSSGSYTGLMLYDGCPLTGSCSSGGTVCCVASATGSSGNKTLTFCARAGVTYYLILDSWPSPTCNAYSDLTISAPSGTCVPNEDCIQAITVCSNASFGGGTSGRGCTQELNSGNQGCLSIENNSNWYIIQTTTSGTLAFTISPSGSQDYDFAVWGPYPSGSTTSTVCPPSTAPIRCSYAAGAGDTGLGNGATDFTEGAGGDRWVAPITVSANQVYVILIDNFTADGAPFNLTWTGTTTLGCTVLPVGLIYFDGYRKNEVNIINWKTLTETNNDFFILERSEDGVNYYEIAKIKGAGNSNTENSYTYNDYKFKSKIQYYRLLQVDFDGSYHVSNPIAITDNDINEMFLLNIYPNPASNEFYLDILSNSNDDIVINITDMFGKKLKTIEQNLSIGNNKIAVSTDKIDAGVLFVNISSKYNSNINITQKIVKH